MITVNLNIANFNNSYFHKRVKQNFNKILQNEPWKSTAKGFFCLNDQTKYFFQRAISLMSPQRPLRLSLPKEAKVKIQRKLQF